MKFVKYNDNKSVTIPPAVLTVCGLDDEGKLEMAGARGAVILSKSEMTAMEMVRTILALTDRAGQDFTGKVLVLSPDTLKESCWSQADQLWYAHDGFGCRPHAIGRSVRCTCLGDGETTRWNRHEFIGVLDEKYLPDWAREKLMELTAPRQEEPAADEMKLE